MIEFKLSVDKDHNFTIKYVDKTGADITKTSSFLVDIFHTIKREYRNHLEPCDMEYPPLCEYYRGKLQACNYGEFHNKNCPYTHGSLDPKSRANRDG